MSLCESDLVLLDIRSCMVEESGTLESQLEATKVSLTGPEPVCWTPVEQEVTVLVLLCSVSTRRSGPCAAS